MKYAIILFLVLLSSCSVIKSIKKDREKTDVQTEAKAEEKTKTETQTDSKAKTITTEEIDTLITTAGGRMTGRSTDLKTEPIIIEEAGFSVFVTDSAGVTKATAVLKPQQIPVKKKKRTEKEEAVKQTVKTQSDSTGENSAKVKTDNSHQDREVKKTGLLFPWWLRILIVLIILGGLAWRFRKRLPF